MSEAKKRKISEHFQESKPTKRKLNRFNGISEEELLKRGLPDYLHTGLDIVFIGINPGLYAAYTGKYYSGPGNHFWKALFLSGLIPAPMSPDDDFKLLDLKMGLTDVVPRVTRGLSDLTKKEIADGSEILRQKILKFKPKIAVFNGKAIYEVYSQKKKFMFGRQPQQSKIGETEVWVMPSSSARCAQLPRAVDKVPFFAALKRFRDYLNGTIEHIEEEEVVFAKVVLKNRTVKVKSEDETMYGVMK